MELKAKKWNLFDCFALMFRATPLWTVIYTVLNILEALTPMLGILTLADFVDTATNVITGAAPYSDVIRAFILMAGVAVYGYVVATCEWFIEVKLSNAVQYYVGEVFIRKRASLKYKYVEDHETQDLIAKVCGNPANDLLYRGEHLVWWLYHIVSNVSTLAVILASVWWSGLVGIAVLIPAVLVAVKNGKESYDTFAKTTEESRYMNVYNSIAGAKDFNEEKLTFGYLEYILGKWHERKKNVDKLNITNAMKVSARENAVSVLGWLMYAGIILSLIPALAAGSITVGLFVGLVNGVQNLVNFVRYSVAGQVQWYVTSRHNLDDLTKFVHLEDEPGALDTPADMTGVKIDKIEFRDVSFKYPNTDRYILKNCSFTLSGDEHYAFVGVNGAGKTTITKLLTRLYDNYEGEILINGRSLRDYTYAEIKGLFTIVYQDFVKYAIEFKDSIKLGNVNLDDDERMLKTVHQIGLDDALAGLHHGIDTPLGKISEDGVDLSGGEWQRVAIARSLYSDAPMKILDEPTAALDPIAESSIYALFKEVTKDCPAIFITHRLGAAKIADKILVIDGGRVAEFGSHAELVAKGGLYAEMYNTQKSWYEA
ncbi:MAG: ABC transporter ATP-binding protein/permease [Clostridia bacterium]|nr:ABC transporter ATP-binding protein/permease [Clostridia bacterium]